jgi:hypothetical protein
MIYIGATTNPATGATTQHIMISSTGSLHGRTGYAIAFSV